MFGFLVYGKKDRVAVMARKNTKFRRAIKIERRVALALWRLATGSSYRNVSKVFGVGMLHENTDFDISIHWYVVTKRCTEIINIYFVASLKIILDTHFFCCMFSVACFRQKAF